MTPAERRILAEVAGLRGEVAQVRGAILQLAQSVDQLSRIARTFYDAGHEDARSPHRRARRPAPVLRLHRDGDPPGA